MKFSFPAKALSWLIFTIGSLAAPAMGQSLISNPAEKMLTSPGGVDVGTGEYAYSETDLSIGGEAGGLTLSRMMIHTAGGANPFGTFTHNWDIQLQEMPVDRDNQRESGNTWSRVLIQMGGRTRVFSRDPNAMGNPYTYGGIGPRELLDPPGGGNIYTYTASDGTVLVFHSITGGGCVAAMASCAYPQEMTAPDGTHRAVPVYRPDLDTRAGLVLLQSKGLFTDTGAVLADRSGGV